MCLSREHVDAPDPLKNSLFQCLIAKLKMSILSGHPVFIQYEI